MIRQKLIFITIFVSKIILGQTNDSLKKEMLEEIKMTVVETIYEYKGTELPGFQLPLLNGEELDSESLKGKPTVILFWTSYCQPCMDKIHLLNNIKSQFGNEVNFISITSLNKNEVNEFLKTTKFDFTHAIESEGYLDVFGFLGYPKTLILDKNLTLIEIEKKVPMDYGNEEQNKADFIKRVSDLLAKLKKD